MDRLRKTASVNLQWEMKRNGEVYCRCDAKVSKTVTQMFLAQ